MPVEQTTITQTTSDPAAELAAITANAAAVEEDSPEVTEGEGSNTEVVDDAQPQESANTTELPPAEVKPFEFEGVTIDPAKIEVPEEFLAGLKTQGLDGAAVAAEMYSEQGLTEGTKEKLYAEFGKTTVDLYVRSQLIETRDKMSQVKSEQDSAQVAQNSINDAVAKELGSNIDFPTLAKWVADTVTPAERAEINEDLSSGRQSTVLRTVRELKANYEKANGQGKPDLLDGGSDETGVDTSPMTAQQYSEAIKSGAYYKNPNHFDQRRGAGLNAGI